MSLAFLYANPGPYQVKQELGVWEDADRDNRQVPYKLYYPADRKDKTPIVIWSHGAGGSREGSAYLGNHLASHGFATVHLQHPGTDSSMLGDDGFSLGFLKKLRPGCNREGLPMNWLQVITFSLKLGSKEHN